ncbi:hypothetical protein HYH02_000978 [Chlamydomonas schloesseri]|uniref:Kinesin motor domain-containing protein n=1 Tax=Chlamydomonas schloesseri TaxID=2026947 RepID=A0A835WXC7_9CHLO|nr:hypothetical protein HYH02_000978 [Chlamydomonas schloesseri]|eukprot:KAG2455162.1 hypothetical protein HYH02_000978 [Chlamydomonas schloesseri]
MADFWTKGLRGGGDVGATPRQNRAVAGQKPGNADKPGPTPADKAKADKNLTPIMAGIGQVRAPHPTVRKVVPLNTENSDKDMRPDSPSKAPSEFSGDGDEEYIENDSVRVFVRVRPATSQELTHDKHEQCLSVIGSRSIQLNIKEKQNTTHAFNFDQVLPENTTQQDVFDLAGVAAVDNCLAGYNSSIFAYGQTGAGKTFTIIGNISNPEKRGLAPRVFDYLFSKIGENENTRGPETVKYNCRASFLEIYNENIGDLLSPSGHNLPIREDPEKGPYVEGLTEPPALNVDEMLSLLLRGAENRHTGETRLNHESSRSHSVFVCTVEKTVTSNGISKCFYAKLNLVDLAGSERIASGAHGGSNVTGEHFKEACNINKSLTALGRVTTELVKSQKAGGGGHVPYRDSKLTFLLQSSLGGNAKTLIIANVSPSSVCSQETLSTLRFAKQTKHIRNDAKVNWTVQGDRLAMQREIERLRMELASARSGTSEPLVQRNLELTGELQQEQQRREELQQERDRLQAVYNQAKLQIRVLDQRLVGLNGMSDRSGISALVPLVDQLEVLDGGCMRLRVELAEAEKAVLESRLAAEELDRAALGARLAEAAMATEAASSKCAGLEEQLAALGKEKAELEESCSVLAQNFSEAGARISEQKEQLAAQAASLQEARDQTAQLESQLAEEQSARKKVEEELAEARSKASQDAEGAAAQAAALQSQLDDRAAELSQQASRMEGLERQLEGALAEVQQLQARLAEAQEQMALTQHEGSERVAELSAKVEAAEGRAAQTSATLDDTTRDLVATREQLAERVSRLAELESQLGAKAAECAEALQKLAETQSGLEAQTAARGTAEAEAASLGEQLAALKEQLAMAEGTGSQAAQALAAARREASELSEQLAARGAELQATEGREAAARAEVEELTARTAALEAAAQEQAAAQVAVEDSLAGARAEAAALKEQVDSLEQQLGEARGEHSASIERATSLSGTVEQMSMRVRELEEANAKQAAEAAERAAAAATAAAALEARLAEVEAAKAKLAEQLEQEQTAAAALREGVTRHTAAISELREQVSQEEARALAARREKAESEAGAQRQMAEIEDRHQQELQKLQDELDRRNVDLKSRDQEMIRSNFALKGEIDRLQSGLEQAKRELSSSKANQEQLVASHQVAIAGMNERLNKQADRYNELSKKHDTVKQQLDAAQREIENWKTKSERLDHAMADVTRLIRFARNPPDSARSSLIMTRSDHLSPNWATSNVSGSRNGPSGMGGATPGSLSLRITESPAESPRMSTSRYSHASPAASKMGSVAASHRIDDDGEEWQSAARRTPDVVSPGDQLPIPTDADDC